MAYGIRLEVWGDYACFTRPELKAERYSYDVMTPSAARGILEAVFWHPGLVWKIDQIFVLAPIAFANIRRNEVGTKLSASNALAAAQKGKPFFQATKKEIVQRASTVLKHPHYVIEAHFDMTKEANASDNSGKFRGMFCRRAKKGQCYHTPYLGCREFPACFQLWEEEEIRTAYPNESRELGMMLYDMDYDHTEDGALSPLFFFAQLTNGVLDVRDVEVYR